MVNIPGGSFQMGDSLLEGSANELPRHTVFISACSMDKLAVSKELWQAVHADALGHGYSFDNAGVFQADRLPYPIQRDELE